ncbi:MAG TPA: PilZ domain-containing protein [Sphingomicrobium sp.]
MTANLAPAPEDPFADRRAYPRVAVALPAFLQADGERHSVQLLDLSPGGAKVDCPVRLPSGTAVILDCGTLGRSAVVRWQNGGLVGLCFDSELDGRDVAALIARSTALAARMNPADQP